MKKEADYQPPTEKMRSGPDLIHSHATTEKNQHPREEDHSALCAPVASVISVQTRCAGDASQTEHPSGQYPFSSDTSADWSINIPIQCKYTLGEIGDLLIEHFHQIAIKFIKFQISVIPLKRGIT